MWVWFHESFHHEKDSLQLHSTFQCRSVSCLGVEEDSLLLHSTSECDSISRLVTKKIHFSYIQHLSEENLFFNPWGFGIKWFGLSQDFLLLHSSLYCKLIVWVSESFGHVCLFHLKSFCHDQDSFLLHSSTVVWIHRVIWSLKSFIHFAFNNWVCESVSDLVMTRIEP